MRSSTPFVGHEMHVNPALLGGNMRNVAQHANRVSEARFGRLSTGTPAKKMSASAPVLFTPAIVVVTAAALITAVGSV